MSNFLYDNPLTLHFVISRYPFSECFLNKNSLTFCAFPEYLTCFVFFPFPDTALVLFSPDTSLFCPHLQLHVSLLISLSYAKFNYGELPSTKESTSKESPPQQKHHLALAIDNELKSCSKQRKFATKNKFQPANSILLQREFTVHVYMEFFFTV